MQKHYENKNSFSYHEKPIFKIVDSFHDLGYIISDKEGKEISSVHKDLLSIGILTDVIDESAKISKQFLGIVSLYIEKKYRVNLDSWSILAYGENNKQILENILKPLADKHQKNLYVTHTTAKRYLSKKRFGSLPYPGRSSDTGPR